MSAARKQSPKSQKLTVSVAALLDAAERGVIELTVAERKAFRKMPKTTPVDLQGAMADAMFADAMVDEKAAAVAALPEIPLEKPAKKRVGKKSIHKTPEVDITNVAPVAPAEPTTKKAKKAKTEKAPRPAGNSRSPEARKARRVLREYLRVSLVATDENEDAEIREIAAARAAHLEQIIGATL